MHAKLKVKNLLTKVKTRIYLTINLNVRIFFLNKIEIQSESLLNSSYSIHDGTRKMLN